MRLNTPSIKKEVTHEGGHADAHIKPLVQLERAVATCLLWENTFYEKGSDVAARIASLCKVVPIESVAALAIKARNDYKLRHVPLFLCVQLIALGSGRKDGLVSKTIAAVVQRPDEMGELIAQYRKEKRSPLADQLKKGLREAFGKFSEYQFSKWNRDTAIKLRDVMFMVRPKPTKEREALYKQIANNTLPVADTWEVALSSGSDKKATWERLLTEKKLGYIALLMNLRNMEEVKVDRSLIKRALLEGAPTSKALPFRFVSAAKHAPQLEEMLGEAMVASLSQKILPGKTVLVVDVSGSMRSVISDKSEVNRVETAAALAVLLREVGEDVVIYATAGSDYSRVHATKLVPPRRAFALIDAIKREFSTLGGGGIFLTQCMKFVQDRETSADRVIVITDEQDCDLKLSPEKSPLIGKCNYIVNVAQYNRAIGFGRWTTISGWSERIVDWIVVEERLTDRGN